MTNIILCGCGALGSNIAIQIARNRGTLTLYDDDKIDVVNVVTGTTIFSREHIGKLKAQALSVILTRKYNIHVYPITKAVSKSVIVSPFLTELPADLIIDCFDNVEARSYTIKPDIPTVHVSIGEQGLGAIEWDDIYELPKSGYERGENPVCTNELGRDLILFTSTVASIIINKYLSTGAKESAYVMLDSLEIFK